MLSKKPKRAEHGGVHLWPQNNGGRESYESEVSLDREAERHKERISPALGSSHHKVACLSSFNVLESKITASLGQWLNSLRSTLRRSLEQDIVKANAEVPLLALTLAFSGMRQVWRHKSSDTHHWVINPCPCTGKQVTQSKGDAWNTGRGPRSHLIFVTCRPKSCWCCLAKGVSK